MHPSQYGMDLTRWISTNVSEPLGLGKISMLSHIFHAAPLALWQW